MNKYLTIIFSILIFTSAHAGMSNDDKSKAWDCVGIYMANYFLPPGEKFEYTSGTPLSTPSGFMGGHYEMETKNGKIFEAIIPQFSLDSPFIKNNLN